MQKLEEFGSVSGSTLAAFRVVLEQKANMVDAFALENWEVVKFIFVIFFIKDACHAHSP